MYLCLQVSWRKSDVCVCLQKDSNEPLVHDRLETFHVVGWCTEQNCIGTMQAMQYLWSDLPFDDSARDKRLS